MLKLNCGTFVSKQAITYSATMHSTIIILKRCDPSVYLYCILFHCFTISYVSYIVVLPLDSAHLSVPTQPTSLCRLSPPFSVPAQPLFSVPTQPPFSVPAQPIFPVPTQPPFSVSTQPPLFRADLAPLSRASSAPLFSASSAPFSRVNSATLEKEKLYLPVLFKYLF